MKNLIFTEQEQNKNTKNNFPKNTEQNRTRKKACSFIPDVNHDERIRGFVGKRVRFEAVEYFK